jgi:hypothetical protein
MKMEINAYNFGDHYEIVVQNEEGFNEQLFTCITLEEVRMFFRGFKSCQDVINKRVQSLPMNFNIRCPQKKTE